VTTRLGHMRALGIRRLNARCLNPWCRHDVQSLIVNDYPDGMMVASFGARMICRTVSHRQRLGRALRETKTKRFLICRRIDCRFVSMYAQFATPLLFSKISEVRPLRPVVCARAGRSASARAIARCQTSISATSAYPYRATLNARRTPRSRSWKMSDAPAATRVINERG
jgi:hypothetical protein